MLKKPITRPFEVANAHHRDIFTFLLNVNKESQLNATLRVAGGWVRDTLLGLHSNDIDVAIESPNAEHPVSGEDFAKAIADFQKKNNMKARTISVIRTNPELSKHIETATICVLDTPIEFCALRQDDYCSESRIPQIRSATPAEDALRRDYTVNSLFYNLHSKAIEDYTTGLEDLNQHILRCPLEPRKTFDDDPLRLLRGVRFVGQLGELNFSLDKSIPACVDQTLFENLLRKVSRERIGKEFVKMMLAFNPEKCVDLLHSMQLMQNVLLVEVYLKDTSKKHASCEIERMANLYEKTPEGQQKLEEMMLLNRHMLPMFATGTSFIQANSDEQLAAILFILTIPYYRRVAQDQRETRLQALFLNGLKLPHIVFYIVRRMMDCYTSLSEKGLSPKDLTPSDKPMANETKLHIFDALIHLTDKQIFPDAFKIVASTFYAFEGTPSLIQEDPTRLQKAVLEAWSYIESQKGLLDAHTRSLPIKGNEIKSLLSIEPKFIGSTLLKIRQHLLLDPTLDRDELLEILKKETATISSQ